MVPGLLKRGIVAVVAFAIVPVSAAAADAPTALTPLPTAGACVVSGSAQFSPGINIVPQTIAVSISVSGSCEGTPLGNSLLGLNVSASPLASCEAGFGPTSDFISFSNDPPGTYSGTGDLILTPASGVATVTAGIIVGVLTFAWTTLPTGCTAPTGVTSTPITGLFTYVSE